MKPEKATRCVRIASDPLWAWSLLSTVHAVQVSVGPQKSSLWWRKTTRINARLDPLEIGSKSTDTLGCRAVRPRRVPCQRQCHRVSQHDLALVPQLIQVSCCTKSLQGEAPCGSAVYGKVDEMSPAPSPSPNPLHLPNPPALTPLQLDPPMNSMTGGRQGGQGRIDDITGARDFALQLS